MKVQELRQILSILPDLMEVKVLTTNDREEEFELFSVQLVNHPQGNIEAYLVGEME